MSKHRPHLAVLLLALACGAAWAAPEEEPQPPKETTSPAAAEAPAPGPASEASREEQLRWDIKGYLYEEIDYRNASGEASDNDLECQRPSPSASASASSALVAVTSFARHPIVDAAKLPPVDCNVARSPLTTSYACAETTAVQEIVATVPARVSCNPPTAAATATSSIVSSHSSSMPLQVVSSAAGVPGVHVYGTPFTQLSTVRRQTPMPHVV